MKGVCNINIPILKNGSFCNSLAITNTLRGTITETFALDSLLMLTMQGLSMSTYFKSDIQKSERFLKIWHHRSQQKSFVVFVVMKTHVN